MCMGSNHSLEGRSGPSVERTLSREEPTQETPAQANPQYPDRGEFWLGRPVTVGSPPATPTPAAPIPVGPVPAAPIPAAPIPAAPIPAADAPPVRVKPALRRSTRVNKRVNPNAANLPRRANVATVMLRCSTVYIYYIMIEL